MIVKNYNGLRAAVSSAYGQELFYFSDASIAFRNLGGGRMSFKMFAARVSRVAVDPAKLGLNVSDYGFSKPIRLYPKSDLWNYFLESTAQAKLKLDTVGVRSFDDIIRIGYNKPDFHDRTTKRRTKRDKAHYGSRQNDDDPRNDEDPALENVRKIRED